MNNTKSKVMLDLLYPSILGAMFTDVLPAFFNMASINGKVLLFCSTILILIYFIIDYVYLQLSTYKITVTSFVLDLFAISIIYIVEQNINPTKGILSLTATPILCLIFIHSSYLIWNFVENAEKELKILNTFIIISMMINLYVKNELYFFILIIIMNLGLAWITYIKYKRLSITEEISPTTTSTPTSVNAQPTNPTHGDG